MNPMYDVLHKNLARNIKFGLKITVFAAILAQLRFTGQDPFSYWPKITAMAAERELPGIVRWHRQQAGLSRMQLALLAGVGKTVVYDLENGKLTLRFDTILRILAALNISVHYDSPLMQNAGAAR